MTKSTSPEAPPMQEAITAVGATVLIGLLAKGVFRAALAAGKKIAWQAAVDAASKEASKLLAQAAGSVQADTVKAVLRMENNTESPIYVQPGSSYTPSGGMVISADDLKANEFDYYSASKNFGLKGATGWTVYTLEGGEVEVLIGWMHSKFPVKNPPFVSCDIGAKGAFTQKSKRELEETYIGLPPRSHPASPDGEQWGYTGAMRELMTPDARYVIRAFYSKEESRYELDKIVSMIDVDGIPLEEAKAKIELANLVIDRIEKVDRPGVESGNVVKQEPSAKEGISDGGVVNLWVAA